MALSDSFQSASSRLPFTLQGSLRNHANLSLPLPTLLLLLVPLLLLTNFEISQTPFRRPAVRHAIKWRQVEWKYQIDCKQKGSMFRQEGKSFRYSKNAALSLTGTNASALIASHVRAHFVWK